MENQIKSLLRAEMDRQGMTNNDLRAGLAAIIGGESHFVPRRETTWSNTANSRIRIFFASRVGGLNDIELGQLKKDDHRFFNYVYGPQFNYIHNLGQVKSSDGWDFRGGGLIQLTGRANYARYGRLAGVDLVDDPDKIVDPQISCAVAVAYMLDRYKWGDFDAMKKAVGISIGEPDELKNQLYEQYVASGEWSQDGDSKPNPEPGARQRVLRWNRQPMTGDDVTQLQNLLIEWDCDPGKVDGIFGRKTWLAVLDYQRSVGLNADGIVGPDTWAALSDGEIDGEE